VRAASGQLLADPPALKVRQHFEQRYVRAEDPVADRADEPDDATAFAREDDVAAAAQEREMAFRRRTPRPADEEPIEVS